MGLTKQYLRYTSAGIFGVVAAKDCNAVYLQPNRFVATGGTHVVTLWDTRLQRKLRVVNCESPALLLTPNEDATLLAVGHQNGRLSVYDLKDKSEEASPEPNFTFEGHTSEILTLAWDDTGTILASGGKDTRLVLWDCVSESGVAKLKGHKGPITRVRFWRESKYLVSSSADATLRIWDMVTHACVHTIPGNSQIWDFALWSNSIFIAESHLRLFTVFDVSTTEAKFTVEELGTILRHANDRTKSLEIFENKYMVSIGAKSPEVEIFYLSSQEQATKRMRKRVKKDPEEPQQIILKDLVRRGDSVRASEGKLRSFDLIQDRDETLKILCCLPSNQLEILSIFPQTNESIKDKEVSELIGFDGHRKMVRGLAFSSDKTAILSASADSFKVWNRSSLTCVLTIQQEYPVVCCKFCPGDRHFIAGTTCGHLILGDVSTGTLTQIEPSGEENVWGVDIYPNNMGFATCNGNMIQLYDFSMADGKLRFDLKRELDVQESILCLKISQNMKFIAVGLLDSTIKVFYLDTLKFHLSMYGHQLPVVSLDISADSNLLTSCSGDKSVKVWGLDFGDCHCTMMHTDGLVGCSFIENTHHIVSVAKDSVNFYDGDNHQRIQTVKAHVEGGSTCMAVGGLYVVTAGRDQTLRLFNRTQEILVLHDEREKEREDELESEAVTETPEIAALQTAESEESADKLIEALDVFKEKSDTNPLLLAYGARNHQEFMLKTLSAIKASELEQSLMLLPVGYVHLMIPAISQVLDNYPLATELAVRCLHGLMKFHLPSLSLANKTELKTVADLAEMRLQELKDTIGFNLAGLRFLNDQKVKREEIEEFREMIGDRKRKKRKRDKALKRAMLTLTV